MRTFLDNPRGPAAIPIDVVGHDATLNPYLCGTVQRRLAYALGPFADGLRRVQVRLTDGRATRGGGKSCQIEMRIRSHDALVVTASDERLDGAITRAAHAAARRVDEFRKRRAERNMPSRRNAPEEAVR